MRTRLLKPGFFVNEDLADCSMAARIYFLGLIAIADREGRIEYRPKRLKMQILPFDDVNIEKLTIELSSKCFIMRYVANGVTVLQVTNFAKHQTIHPKEAKSLLPEPPKDFDGARELHGEPGNSRASLGIVGSPRSNIRSNNRSRSSLKKEDLSTSTGSVEIPTALDTPEFRLEWAAFVEQRKKQAPLTPRATQLIFAKLEAMGVADAIKSLQQSTERGYRGVFPTTENKQSAPTYLTAHERRLQREAQVPALVGAFFEDLEARKALKIENRNALPTKIGKVLEAK